MNPPLIIGRGCNLGQACSPGEGHLLRRIALMDERFGPESWGGESSGKNSRAPTAALSIQQLNFFSKGTEILRLLDPLCQFLQKAWKYLGIHMPQGQPLTNDYKHPSSLPSHSSSCEVWPMLSSEFPCRSEPHGPPWEGICLVSHPCLLSLPSGFYFPNQIVPAYLTSLCLSFLICKMSIMMTMNLWNGCENYEKVF